MTAHAGGACRAAWAFSGSGLEWVVNAYALAFGGLMLLGGRAGDLLGRRNVFIAGLLVFSAASLAGGFATSQSWLLAARAVQGAGAAIVAPTALALITTTFSEGKPRNQAMGVYAAMSVAGGAVGLIAGGLLTTYLSWRWVLFVNVPIGVVAALAAPRVLRESGRQRGRLDLPGAVTATGGLAALVYGLTSTATSPDGVSHWGDAKVIVSLAVSAVVLATFAVIQARSRHALLPLCLLADRDRTGANLILLCVGTAIFGMFFFLTVFMEAVWGYSALKTGLAYLPLTAGIMVASGTTAELIPRVGARPLLLAGAPTTAGGLYWLSRLGEHGSYAGAVLGPMLVIAVGLGLLFVPLTLVAMSRVADAESGVAASLRNTGQQVGGSIGLAVLGTVAWTVVANSVHAQAARATAAARAGYPARPSQGALTAIYHHALTAGFSRAFLVASGVMLLGLIIAIVAIRVRRADLGEARFRTTGSPDPGSSSRSSHGGTMKLTIVAATGGVGRELLEQAVAAGHDVTAVVRNPAKLSRQVQSVTADLSRPDPAVLQPAVVGADAVLSGLGPHSNADAGIASAPVSTVPTRRSPDLHRHHLGRRRAVGRQPRRDHRRAGVRAGDRDAPGVLDLRRCAPGHQIIGRDYWVHILVLPALAGALLLAGLRPPPRRPRRVRPDPLLPFTCAVLVLLGAIAQINPVWLVGPYQPGSISAGAVPDWYMGFLDGLLRIMPAWELLVAGHRLALGVLIPGLVLPALFFTCLALYPLADRRIAGGRPPRGMLPPTPADVANRTAAGAGLTFYGLLWVAAANDQIAYHLHLDLYTVTWIFRVLVLAGPALAFGLTRVICQALAGRRREEDLHGHQTGRIVMNPQGGYTDIGEPARRAAPPGADRPGPAAARQIPDGGPMPWTGRA